VNPELRRNLWLELTTHRMIAMPGVLFLIFAMFVATDRSNWPAAVFSTAVALFVLLVQLWGVRQASEAVTEEVRDRTWDWQRLSALSPWQMAWGKLAGATAFTWYGGAICLVAMGIATAAGAGRDNAVWLALALVASGIALHAALLAASLQAARKDSRLSYRIGTVMLLPALLVAGGFLFAASRSDMGSVSWHGERYEAMRFVAFSSVAFALWGVLAAYRQMCSELRAHTLPWAWPAFALFLSVYFAGFAPRYLDSRSVFIMAGLYTSLVLTYYALFTDRITAMTLRRLVAHASLHGSPAHASLHGSPAHASLHGSPAHASLHGSPAHAQARQWRRVVEEMPMLVSTLALAIVFACAAPWAVASLPFGRYFPTVAAYPIASVLFLARDVGLLVFFALGRRPKRVEGVTLLYIVLLDWVIPGLLGALGLRPLAMAIMPMGKLDGWQAALVIAAHVVIVWALVAWRWRKAFGVGAKV
jgi:hypothetical protein